MVFKNIDDLYRTERLNQYKKNHKFLFDFEPVKDRLQNHKITEYLK